MGYYELLKMKETSKTVTLYVLWNTSVKVSTRKHDPLATTASVGGGGGGGGSYMHEHKRGDMGSHLNFKSGS